MTLILAYLRIIEFYNQVLAICQEGDRIRAYAYVTYVRMQKCKVCEQMSDREIEGTISGLML